MVVGVHDWQGCVIMCFAILYRNGSEIVIPLINITVEICSYMVFDKFNCCRMLLITNSI